MDAHLDPALKHDTVLLFDVTDGNPNGDPDNAGAPRSDIETNQGLVTDVALKRKIRDMVPLIAAGRPGYDIYVEAGVALEAQHRRAYTALGLDLPNKSKKDKTANPEADVRAWMLKTFWDVRVFGAVMASSVAPAGKTKGPVQISFARSIDPVVTIPHGITRVTQTRQADIDEGQSTEMGTKWTVPYGLYRCTVNYSAPQGAKVGVTSEDLEVFWRAVMLMFEHDRSATRGLMAMRGVYVFTHDDALGRAPVQELTKLITVARAEGHKTPRAFEHYTVRVEQDALPAGVTLTRLIG